MCPWGTIKSQCTSIPQNENVSIKISQHACLYVCVCLYAFWIICKLSLIYKRNHCQCFKIFFSEILVFARAFCTFSFKGRRLFKIAVKISIEEAKLHLGNYNLQNSPEKRISWSKCSFRC